MGADLASSPRLPVLAALLLSLLTVALYPRLGRSVRAGACRVAALLPARWTRDGSLDAPLWRFTAASLLLAAFALVTVTSGDYGYNVDEGPQRRLGAAIVDWYARSLSQREYRQFDMEIVAINHYGGFFEVFAEFAARISPLDHTSTRHLITAWFGVLGLLGVYLLGCTLHSRATGSLTLLLLLLTPRFYGHFFSNSKDLPFAVVTVFALLAICRCLPLLPRLTPTRIAIVGGAIGAVMGIRVAGVITLVFFALTLAWWLGGEILSTRERDARLQPRDLLALIGSGLGVACVAWLMMLVFWPWAQSAPLLRPVQALGYFRDIVAQLGIDFPVFFEGRDYRLSTVPRYFTLEFLLISAPEIAVLAPLVGSALLGQLRNPRLAWPSSRNMAWIVVGASIVLPLATTTSRGIIQYDGIRHFLFVIPSMALVLSGSLVAILAGPVASRFKAGFVVAMISLSAITVWDMRQLHPYQYVYFNRSIAGGLGRAARFYETDFLGLSYREGVRWVLANYRPQVSRQIRIVGCRGFEENVVDGLATDPANARRFRPVHAHSRPDIAVALTRVHCRDKFPGRVLNRVKRQGVPLLYVIELGDRKRWLGR